MNIPSFPSRPARRWRFAIACVAAQLVLLLPGPGPQAVWGEPTRFEMREVEAQALEAFRNIMGLWQEELYFELYDHGMEATKSRIKLENFAQRMVELSWVLQGELNPKFLKSRFRFRTMVYVSARVQYRHKFNPDRNFFKDHIFLLLEEKGSWRVDLIQLVRAPFA